MVFYLPLICTNLPSHFLDNSGMFLDICLFSLGSQLTNESKLRAYGVICARKRVVFRFLACFEILEPSKTSVALVDVRRPLVVRQERVVVYVSLQHRRLRHTRCVRRSSNCVAVLPASPAAFVQWLRTD